MFLIYSSKSADDIVQEFKSSAQAGLTTAQAALNQNKYGLNTLLVKEKTGIDFLIAQYKSPIVILLLVVCIISLFVGEYVNSITIFCIVVINTSIGCYQEYMATRSVKLLEKFLEHTSKVVRNGVLISIPSKKVVPGDIVLLSAGDYIPADIRFIQAQNLLIDESRFSGESLPVEKTDADLPGAIENVFHAYNIGFSGTVVVEGSGRGIVFATGPETFFGKMSDVTLTSLHETKFFQNIKRISYFLVILVTITLIALIVFYLLFRPSTISLVQIIMFAIALSVGIVPEALPVITTFSLSRGALLLARNSVIVKRLASIEDLGGIDVLCVDKTGTITENILTVFDVYSPSGDLPVMYMALSAAQEFEKNKKPDSPFDCAAWNALSPTDFDTLASYKRVVTVPFDAKHRRTLVVVAHDAHHTLIARGDYEEIIKRSVITQKEQAFLSDWVGKKAQQGCRVMAVSKKDILTPSGVLWDYEHEMEFVGVIALHDPIKKSVKPTLKRVEQLGLQIKIITGDGPAIAGHIAIEIGLIKNQDQVITGDAFEALSDDQKELAAYNYVVFSRFLPQQKSQVIKILKKSYNVAFLGDGINDVVAIKEADVGIGVSGAHDVVKDAADILLLKKSLGTIVDGIVIGRKIFSNIFTYLKTSLTSSVGNFYSIAVASLFMPFLPLLPLQILLINLLSDLPMIAISTDQVDVAQIEHPNKYDLKRLTLFIVTFGLISSLFDLVFFYYLYDSNEPIFQTRWFIFSILTELLFIFSARSKAIFFRAIAPSFWLSFFALLSCCVTILLPYTTFGRRLFSLVRLPIADLWIMAGIALLFFVACELFKWVYFSKSQKN